MGTTSTLNPASCRRLLLFAPHPDDETLTTGGLVQQVLANGAQVRVVFITDGGNNPWPQRVLEKRWRIRAADQARWGARRRGEALNSLATLGVPPDGVRFLDYADQGVTGLLLAGEDKLVEELAAEITEFRPDIIIAPSMSDHHKDHNAFAVLLQMAIDRIAPGKRDFLELYYVTHGRRTHIPAPDYRLSLSSDERAKKRAAILCHKSQVQLSHGRFTSFADGDEIFFRKPPALAQEENHPVRGAWLEDGKLRLELALEESPDEYILHVVSKSSRRTLLLPAKSSSINVMDSCVDAIVTQAQFLVGRGNYEVAIPLSGLAPDERIFVKLDSRSGFYDAYGWREIPAVPRQNLAPVPAIMPPRVCCVVPCYNVADRCGEVLRQVASHADIVIAVNDGSSDDTEKVLKSVSDADRGKIRLISYPENRGKGAALLTAFQLALQELRFDVLVTIDSDGQHNATDIPRLVQSFMEQKSALVIGERTPCKSMPWRSRLGNSLTSGLFRRLYPASPRDTQSGLRAMSREFIEAIVKTVKPRRYETELQILMLALDLQIPLSTVPIKTIYFDQNRLSHFRPVKDSFRIYWALMMWHLLPRAEGIPSAGAA